MNVVLFIISTNLSEVSSSPTLHQRNVCGQTHPVDVVPGLPVVQSVHHDVELLEPVPVVLVLHDGPVQGVNGTLRGEPMRQNKYIFLKIVFMSNLPESCFLSAGGFGLSNMLLLKEKLSVQVGDVDGVQINDDYVLEAWIIELV